MNPTNTQFALSVLAALLSFCEQCRIALSTHVSVSGRCKQAHQPLVGNAEKCNVAREMPLGCEWNVKCSTFFWKTNRLKPFWRSVAQIQSFFHVWRSLAQECMFVSKWWYWRRGPTPAPFTFLALCLQQRAGEARCKTARRRVKLFCILSALLSPLHSSTNTGQHTADTMHYKNRCHAMRSARKLPMVNVWHPAERYE